MHWAIQVEYTERVAGGAYRKLLFMWFLGVFARLESYSSEMFIVYVAFS